MPEKQITVEQERAIDSWLRDQSSKGVEVDLFHSSNEGTVLTDCYRVGMESLILVTDLANRGRLNRVNCSEPIAKQLEQAGVVQFSDHKSQPVR